MKRLTLVSFLTFLCLLSFPETLRAQVRIVSAQANFTNNTVRRRVYRPGPQWAGGESKARGIAIPNRSVSASYHVCRRLDCCSRKPESMASVTIQGPDTDPFEGERNCQRLSALKGRPNHDTSMERS